MMLKSYFDRIFLWELVLGVIISILCLCSLYFFDFYSISQVYSERITGFGDHHSLLTLQNIMSVTACITTFLGVKKKKKTTRLKSIDRTNRDH